MTQLQKAHCPSPKIPITQLLESWVILQIIGNLYSQCCYFVFLIFFLLKFKFDHELCFITENKQRKICRNITTTSFHICASAMPRAKRSSLLSWSYLLNTAFPDKNTQFQVFSLYSPFTVNGQCHEIFDHLFGLKELTQAP